MSKSDYLFVFLACFTGCICYFTKGSDSLVSAFGYSFNLLVLILPTLVGGLLLSGLIQQFIDQDKINKALGEKSGFSGLILSLIHI